MLGKMIDMEALVTTLVVTDDPRFSKMGQEIILSILVIFGTIMLDVIIFDIT